MIRSILHSRKYDKLLCLNQNQIFCQHNNSQKPALKMALFCVHGENSACMDENLLSYTILQLRIVAMHNRLYRSTIILTILAIVDIGLYRYVNVYDHIRACKLLLCLDFRRP